jgi:hypothetical protein
MPFIQLRRTNGRSDDVFTLIFDEEREKIIMRENFCYARKKDTKEKEEMRKKSSLFFSSSS